MARHSTSVPSVLDIGNTEGGDAYRPILRTHRPKLDIGTVPAEQGGGAYRFQVYPSPEDNKSPRRPSQTLPMAWLSTGKERLLSGAAWPGSAG